MSTILNAPAEEKRRSPHTVEFFTAAAPPPEAVLAAMAEAGFNVTHLYGLTETYGPAVVNDWNADWEALDGGRAGGQEGAPGCALPCRSRRWRSWTPRHMAPVPRDGETMGEVMFRGNVVMKGYLKNTTATDAAFKGGWFHSGDLGVMHPDGYIQLKDRSKDIIISGGENISSIEVEDALYKHPAVQAAAVVAKPDEKWGETPCAFVELKPGKSATADELIAWCRDGLARYKVPRHVVFAEMPEDQHRQDPEVQAARDGEGDVRLENRAGKPPFASGSRQNRLENVEFNVVDESSKPTGGKHAGETGILGRQASRIHRHAIFQRRAGNELAGFLDQVDFGLSLDRGLDDVLKGVLDQIRFHCVFDRGVLTFVNIQVVDNGSFENGLTLANVSRGTENVCHSMAALLSRHDLFEDAVIGSQRDLVKLHVGKRVAHPV